MTDLVNNEKSLESQDPEKMTPASEAETLAATSADIKEKSEVLTTPEESEGVETPSVEMEVSVEVEETATPTDVHSMSKEMLLERLRAIVEGKDVNAHRDVTAIKQALFALRQREVNEEMLMFVEAGNRPEDFSATPDELEEEAKRLVTVFRELRTAFLEEEEKRLAENVERKRAILAEMEAIVADADNVGINYNKFQQLQKDFKEIKDVTPAAETELWKDYQSTNEAFYDTLKMNKELRDLDFKKNLEAKRRIITETLALDAQENILEAFNKLKLLHAEWREIGPVVKDLRDSIWEEFRAASALVNKKHQEFFEARKEEERKNEEAKLALCVELEAIDFSSLKTKGEWNEATDKVKELQAKWKTIGFAARKANNELFSRFRKGCDAFFEAKSEYVKESREKLEENLAKKIALCEQAEALKDAEGLKKNLDAVIKLQSEWKQIGAAPRKQSDSVWERFSKACNEIFDAHKKKNNERRNEENANLEAKREIIAKLKEIPHDIERREGLKQVKELQNQWQAIGHVPFKQKDALYKDYRAVCDALYEAFQSGRDAERRQNFAGKVEEMAGDDRKIRSEKERLQRVLETKLQELKTYANNLGFFNVKSSAGNSMLKDMERKMKRIEQDITEIREKIALLEQV